LAANWNQKAKKWVNGRKNFPSFSFQEKTIWMHCSSLGEFEQGRPVLEALRKQYPSTPIILSFFSPSGYEIRKNYAGADQVIYLPMDSSRHAKKLITAINPALVIWVKYEYWYYYLTELKKREIPVLLVSGILGLHSHFSSGMEPSGCICSNRSGIFLYRMNILKKWWARLAFKIM